MFPYPPLPAPCPSQYRWNRFKALKHAIEEKEGGFDKFSQGESKGAIEQEEGFDKSSRVSLIPVMIGLSPLFSQRGSHATAPLGARLPLHRIHRRRCMLHYPVSKPGVRPADWVAHRRCP